MTSSTPQPTRRLLSPSQAAAGQRERLMHATIDLIGEHGYAATTLSEVLAHARVSRKTFYRYFTNKRECFLAACDALVAAEIEQVPTPSGEAHALPDDTGSGLEALFEHVIENPRFPRLVLVEIRAVGSDGIARREQLLSTYERLLQRGLELSPAAGTSPNPLLRALLGGVMNVLYARARSSPRALRLLLPELLTWSTSYSAVPAAVTATLRDPQPSPTRAGLVGGRAPGTLRLGLARSPPQSATRRANGVSRSFIVHSQREQILDAVVNLTAAEGYAELKVEEIAREAGVSPHVFYEHFAGKEDAFLVAHEVGQGKGRAIAERAYASRRDWPSGVRAAIAALFDFLATEAAFADIALAAALFATARSAKRSNLAVSALAQMLIPGLDEAGPDTTYSTLTIEAIAGGIFELCVTHAIQNRVAELSELVPTATYFALAPFIGIERAGRVATEPLTA